VLVCPVIPDLQLIEKYFARHIRYDRLYSLPFTARAFGPVFERLLVQGFLALLLTPIACVLHRHSVVTVELDPFFPSSLRRIMRLRTYILYLSVPKPTYAHSRRLQRAQDWLWWTLWRPAGDNYVAHSHTTENALLTAGVRSRWVLYPPVSEHWFARSNDRKKQLVSFARMSPEKKFETCIRAFAGLHSSLTTTLVLAGSTGRYNPYLERLRRLTRELGVDHAVIFQTNPSISAMRASAIQSKAYVSCQTEPESFNITVLEAMAAGCIPIVPPDLFKELVLQGIGFSYSNESELTQTMKHVLNLSQSEFAELSKRSRERASQFTQEKFADALLMLLKGHFTEAAGRRVENSKWPLSVR
jgi:glycosyltransferase involved in cell wall biosynthesis